MSEQAFTPTVTIAFPHLCDKDARIQELEALLREAVEGLNCSLRATIREGTCISLPANACLPCRARAALKEPE